MPKEAAVVELAGALVESNPFDDRHRQAAEALGAGGATGPIWGDQAARQAVVERLQPFVHRLRARAGRCDPGRLQHPSVARRLDGLAAAWAAVAPDDPRAVDLRWLGRPDGPKSDALTSVRVGRLRVLEDIRRAWPGAAPAARKLRAAIWRAAWLTDAFIDLRAEPRRPVPVVIKGPVGAPRSKVAALLGGSVAPGSSWCCRLPGDEAAKRIREAGADLLFVDRLEHASETVVSALIERLSGPGEADGRWVLGVTAGEEGAVDPELWQHAAGIEVEIPPLPALLARGGLPGYVQNALAPFGAGAHRTHDIARWIERRIGAGYAWPGHLAELARCVRARLNGDGFAPTPSPATTGLPAPFVTGLREGAIDADTLLSRYCTWVYALTGSYVATAGRLGIDRRTVRRRVDRTLLPIFADHRPD